MGEVIAFSEDQYIGDYDGSGRMHGIGAFNLANGDKYTGYNRLTHILYL